MKTPSGTTRGRVLNFPSDRADADLAAAAFAPPLGAALQSAPGAYVEPRCESCGYLLAPFPRPDRYTALPGQQLWMCENERCRDHHVIVGDPRPAKPHVRPLGAMSRDEQLAELVAQPNDVVPESATGHLRDALLILSAHLDELERHRQAGIAEAMGLADKVGAIDAVAIADLTAVAMHVSRALSILEPPPARRAEGGAR